MAESEVGRIGLGSASPCIAPECAQGPNLGFLETCAIAVSKTDCPVHSLRVFLANRTVKVRRENMVC